MRKLRKLRDGVWYRISISVNRHDPVFQTRQTIALFAQVLGEVAVQKRCKQTGMRWNAANAREMVTLTVKEEGGSLGAVVRDFIMAA